MPSYKKPIRLPEPLAEALLNTAHEYQSAGGALSTIKDPPEDPLYFLYAHSIELILKAFVRAVGREIPKIHDLVSLLALCEKYGLRIDPHSREAIRLLNSENQFHGFRYFAFVSTTRPEIGYLRETVASLIKLVASEVEKRPTDAQLAKGVVVKATIGKAVRKQ